jgi:glycosyltransferase involved in cell wall biosynthesis
MKSTPTTPLVDIGIPVFARSHFVATAIESVLAQSFQEWRLVVSEDGPGSDAVARAVEPYLGDERITFVTTGAAVGAARHMTRLIQAGSAPYVALLHDDDRWGSTFLASRVEFLESHPDCGFVFSAMTLLDEDGVEFELGRKSLSPGVHHPHALVPKLLRNNLVPTPTVLARRSAYEAVGSAFEPRLRRIYDYEMWLRLALNGPVGYLNARDASWRVHGEQSSRSLDDRTADFKTFLEIADALVSEHLPRARLSRTRRRRTLSSWLLTNSLDAIEQRDRPLARSSLREALETYPPSVFDPRVLTALLALLLGRPASMGVKSLRAVVRRHGIRAHVRRN